MLASLIAAALATSPYNAAANTDGLPEVRIHCGHLIDTEAGKLLGESTITVQNGRIKDVHAGNATSGGNVDRTRQSKRACLASSTATRI